MVAPDAPEAVRWAADDVVRVMGAMGLEVSFEERSGELACAGEVGTVALVGDALAGVSEPSHETDQSWSIDETSCGAGRLVELGGGGLLGRQYAAYEWLHQLGARFFHPEEEVIPDEPEFSAAVAMAGERHEQHTPDFEYRSVSLHLTHPLELGDAFRLGDESTFDDAVRYIDWQVKNLASVGTGGVGTGEHRDRGIRRGFPRSSGFRLYGTQQGDTAILDPDDPRPDTEQIADAIEERMAVENPPKLFGIGFDPSEFTEADDETVVRQLTFVADYFAETYPDVILQTTVHGTHGDPTPSFGVPYYELPQFAPTNLGAKVHTLMFYDLFRPAPVYGNADFNRLYDWMEREHTSRENIWYFPEAAWWLTFDIPVPLYLPITLEARDRDIQGIEHMLSGGLNGHRVFGTGHEWGYWQNEYCSLRMSANVDYRWTDCLDDIASVMGSAQETFRAVVEEAAVRQADFMFDPEVIRWLVGTDDETEVAASIGASFHPLPPAPREILRWEEADLDRWDEVTAPALEAIELDFRAFANRLGMEADGVPTQARNVYGEVEDGLRAFSLRARHQRLVYGALVKLRRSKLAGEPALALEAETDLMWAGSVTMAVIELVHAREEGYRYPLERSIAGGPDGTEDENWTIYPYRYLNRTHRGFYFTRIDALAQEAFDGASGPVEMQDTVLGEGESLSMIVTTGGDVSVDFGDGSSDVGPGPFTHDYEPGVYEVVVSGERDGEPFEERIPVARVITETHTGFSGRVIEPMGAEVIEGVLPALVFGRIDTDEGGRVALGFAGTEDHHVSAGGWVELVDDVEAGIRTAPLSVSVPVINRSTGSPLTSLTVEDAVLVGDASAPILEGMLGSDDVVSAVVSIGGFDEQGARRLLAETLGYTPETLPDTLSFRVEFTAE